MSTPGCDGCSALQEIVTNQRLRCSDHEDLVLTALRTQNWSIIEDLYQEIADARMRRVAEHPREMGHP